MVVVDSSVWIDFFNGTPNPARAALRALLSEGDAEIIVPDLVLFEVLRDFRGEREHRQAERLLLSLSVAASSGAALALRAAQHDRALRASGFTIRSGIDVLIATFCIEHDHALLHRDADFDAFERLRGLRVWRH